MVLEYQLFTKQTGYERKIFKVKEIYGYTLTYEPELTWKILNGPTIKDIWCEIYTIEFMEKENNKLHKGFVLRKNVRDSLLDTGYFNLKKIYTDAELIVEMGISDMEHSKEMKK